jgi:hypothetical protein
VRTQEKLIERVLSLSSQALAEEKRDKFIRHLQERAPLLERLAGAPMEAEEGFVRTWLQMESAISARIEREKRRLLMEMENLSARKKAMGRYSPKFPFPPMPVFFDRAW